MLSFHTAVFILMLALLGVKSELTWAKTYLPPDSMFVITANDKPLQNIDIVSRKLQEQGKSFQIYSLDAVDEFEEKLSEGLLSSEDDARAILLDRIEQTGKENFNVQLIAAYQGLLTAFKYQLDRYPAVIFDDQVVVYGATDLDMALRKYHAWKYDDLINRYGKHR